MTKYAAFVLKGITWCVKYVNSIKWSHCMLPSAKSTVRRTHKPAQVGLMMATQNWRWFTHLLFAVTNSCRTFPYYGPLRATSVSISGTCTGLDISVWEPTTSWMSVLNTRLTHLRITVLISRAEILYPLVISLTFHPQFCSQEHYQDENCCSSSPSQSASEIQGFNTAVSFC